MADKQIKRVMAVDAHGNKVPVPEHYLGIPALGVRAAPSTRARTRTTEPATTTATTRATEPARTTTKTKAEEATR